MARLEDVCEILDSRRVPITASNRIAGPYPYYGANGIQDYVADYIFDDELILLAEDGGNFGSKDKPIAYRVSGKCWVNNHAHVLKPKVGYDVDYVCYSLMYYDVSGLVNGATRQKLTQADMRKMTIPDRTPEGQKHIASTLGRVESLISLRKQQLVKLDELVKARFAEVFGDPVANPMRWQETELLNHLEIIGGYAFKSEGFREVGIPVLRIGNINSGYFLPVNMVYWPDDLALERYKMFPGDLVMSLTGTVGKDDYGNVCILGNEFPEYYLNQRNAKLSLNSSVNKHYLSELLKFSEIKGRLTGISRGIRQANISNKDILHLRVPIPPAGLQQQFGDFVAQTDKSKLTIQKGIDNLEMLKKALMQEYFG